VTKGVKLAEFAPEEYAAQILPVTASLWAGRRDFDTYVRQTLEIARSAYGKKFYRTVALYDGGEPVASFKRYQRTIRHEDRPLRAFGIGAVFTPVDRRGRGYASAMLATALDQWRAQGADVAYLFSDIRPQFYAEIGFAELPSRAISLRADALPNRRIVVDRVKTSDWPAIARCFAALEAQRGWGFERSATVWNWVRMRIGHGSEHTAGEEVNLVVRRGREIAAYVLGARAPTHDAYLLDEFGFATARDADLMAPLLRSAAGDLRRIAGWLPPSPARTALPRGAVRKRKIPFFMAAALSSAGHKWLAVARDASAGDGVWSTDHV
jgi:predicted N-acetyltransferase YhbS